MSPARPPVALTCGEPAGIGPEITAGAWAAVKDEMAFFVVGDPAHFEGSVSVVPIRETAECAAAMARGIPVLARPFPDPRVPGVPSPANAPAVVDAIAEAVSLTRAGIASAVCTNPIHKKALIDGAGFAYPGHTEYLAALGGVGRVVMMLAGPGLRVVPTTIHIALSEVPKALTPDLLEDTIRITAESLARDFGIERPRLAVAGLNPHAGEGGAMGTEEIRFITPLLDRLRAEGMAVTGPHSADTMFHARARDGYDAAIAMYHDQALIPIKTIAFDAGVNVTLGLPFVRTSPDHGTAFDIAGKGLANPSSLIAALRLARDMGAARQGRGD